MDRFFSHYKEVILNDLFLNKHFANKHRVPKLRIKEKSYLVYLVPKLLQDNELL